MGSMGSGVMTTGQPRSSGARPGSLWRGCGDARRLAGHVNQVTSTQHCGRLLTQDAGRGSCSVSTASTERSQSGTLTSMRSAVVSAGFRLVWMRSLPSTASRLRPARGGGCDRLSALAGEASALTGSRDLPAADGGGGNQSLGAVTRTKSTQSRTRTNERRTSPRPRSGEGARPTREHHAEGAVWSIGGYWR